MKVLVLFLMIGLAYGQMEDLCQELGVSQLWRLVARDLSDITWEEFANFFASIDYNDDWVLSGPEFRELWDSISGMTKDDTRALFNLLASQGDDEDSDVITDDNLWYTWQQLTEGEEDEFVISKEAFTEAWIQLLLDELPDGGCGSVFPFLGFLNRE